jgi:hypothetical protein
MTDENELDLDRRDFLKRSAVGALGLAGFAAQDEPTRPRYTRRMAFNYPERLNASLVRKIILLTDKTSEDPDVSEVDGCEFSNWPPERLTVWEGIIVEWEGALQGFFRTTTPEVRAEQLVERKQIYVDEQDTPPELGTPYIVNRLESCPGETAGVTATQIPGIDIKTGPDVSTGGGTSH